jgi:hypothetical protein
MAVPVGLRIIAVFFARFYSRYKLFVLIYFRLKNNIRQLRNVVRKERN